jgi:PelA/Pel-15E family pectate lyase
VDTGEDIVNSEPTPTVFSIFKKSFPANSTVSLGQNGQSKTCGQYMVIVRRPGQTAVVATPDPKALASRTCPWDACITMPAEWYGTSEAIRIADNVLVYQRHTGGWYKGIDMAAPMTENVKNIVIGQKTIPNDSTIDNNATTTQMIYLARVYNATKQDRFKEGFLKGVDYLLKAQYANGGWPQYAPPNLSDPNFNPYWAHITFNDNAMINVMTLLRAVASDPAYEFVDKARRDQAAQAVQRGLALILKTQIVVNGKKTAWCAQYDENTLAPAQARAYELPSISGQESVPIVRFLMGIDKPSPEIVDAIQSAVAWFEKSKITGIEVVDKRDAPGGLDRVVIQNPNAPPIWARFYDIETNKPFFVGRDSVKKATLAEIEQERRAGYAYYTTAPTYLLATEYPAWKKKWMP